MQMKTKEGESFLNKQQWPSLVRHSLFESTVSFVHITPFLWSIMQMLFKVAK